MASGFSLCTATVETRLKPDSLTDEKQKQKIVDNDNKREKKIKLD